MRLLTSIVYLHVYTIYRLNAMKRSVCFLVLVLFSCRKNDVRPDTFLSFVVDGEAALINHEALSVTIKLGEDAVWESVKVDFTTSGNAALEIGGSPVSSGSTVDLSGVSQVVLKSANGSSQTYSLEKSSVFEEFGMGKTQQRWKSLNRSYSFYFDQYGTGLHQYINCGPTVSTMALKWSDSTFQLTPLDARNAVLPEGGWWYTNHIYDYLRKYGVTPGYFPLAAALPLSEYEAKMAEIIDSGHLAILCLDMYYVKENSIPGERTNRFYAANSQGWGHFLLVKGYRIIDGKMWLEIHDPYSIDKKYTNGQLKGDRRYYDPAEIKKATDIWWPYALIVPRKNSTLQARFRTDEGRVPAQKGRGVFR